MDTPICDFVRSYIDKNTIRMHMPGHKGKTHFGIEAFDLTEIKGADSLYEAEGIIAKSEKNASALFGCKTYYSTEGSSLSIRAMLYLTLLYAKVNRRSPLIFAGRNAHKTLINTAALLDFDIKWLSDEGAASYLTFSLSPEMLNRELQNATTLPVTVYVTSPDYLGNTADIKGLSKVCEKYGVLLLVDNAHGAYLRFLPKSQFPTDLGATMCCSSAHKTLPVLTGGAYLHISNNAPAFFCENAKNALSLFGSTSPSYIILQSLDEANQYLCEDYKENLEKTTKKIRLLKEMLTKKGYRLTGNEPLKITVAPKEYGYTGYEFADILRSNNIECEFSDPDYIVLMLTPDTTDGELSQLYGVMGEIPRKTAIKHLPPPPFIPKKGMSIREAVTSFSEKISVKDSIGRILAFSEVGCPPAVPIVTAGEVIDENALRCFEYYGIDSCLVVK